MATSTRPPYTKLTYLLSSYYRREGTTSLPRWRRGTIPHARDTLRSLAKQNGKSTSCASFPYCFPTTTTTRLPKGRRAYPKGRRAYSPLIRTTMEPLPHGLWSCSSKPLTGRTGLQTEGRFSLLEPQHWRHHYSLKYRNTPPDKDSSNVDDMPCRTPLH